MDYLLERKEVIRDGDFGPLSNFFITTEVTETIQKFVDEELQLKSLQVKKDLYRLLWRTEIST